jgi:MYND finger
MKCAVCFATTKGYKCSQCSTIYCSSECQTRDWTKNNHRSVCNIDARTKQNRLDENSGKHKKQEKRKAEVNEMDICKDETDPINFDEFQGMDPRDIIILDGVCYHLPSIYSSVENHGNTRNPKTNVEFTAAAREHLIRTALERYPLALHITEQNGRTYHVSTTSLISPDAMLIRIISQYSFVETPFQALIKMAEGYMKFAVQSADDQTIPMIQFMRQHQYEQLSDIFGNDVISINIFQWRDTAIRSIALLQSYKAYAKTRGWARDLIKAIINRIERNAALAQIRRPREYDIRQLPLEDQYVLNIHINTAVGRVYGLLPVIVGQDDTLETLEQNIRARAVDIMPLPDGEMTFIYAGIIYFPETVIGQLPNIANNSTITVYFR